MPGFHSPDSNSGPNYGGAEVFGDGHHIADVSDVVPIEDALRQFFMRSFPVDEWPESYRVPPTPDGPGARTTSGGSILRIVDQFGA